METRTIKIKSFEKTSGPKKDGTEWHRISIKATDGYFYSSFKPITEAALVPGAELTLQVTQSKIKENTYDIQKVISFNDIQRVISFTPPNANPEGSQSQSGEITKPISAPPALEDADIYARELMDRAMKMAHEKMPSWEETSEYPYLIATLIQTMHAKLTSDRISEQEAEKLKAYGNKKW
jgi:hypothetical protein